IIEYPESYPHKPPKVRFAYPYARIWHPNVCLWTDTVRAYFLSSGWTPALALRTLLISIRALLSTPEPRQWINYAAGRQYVRQREIFE
ncbi:Ubiquitin-conjugating enzyme, partial [Aphelenchoides avenae]